MRPPRTPEKAPIVITVLASCIISACGGSAESSLAGDQPLQVAEMSSSNSAGVAAGITRTSSPSPAIGTKSKKTASTITNVEILSTTTTTAGQSNVPITFGQVFRPGDVPATNGVSVTRSDGTLVPYQLDVKARHADGSLKHGIFSVTLSSLDPGKTEVITLSKTASLAPESSGLSPSNLLNAGFAASVNLSIGGKLYSASADALLRSGKYTTWLAGPVANEWLVSTPLKTTEGIEHPHLTARFAIRSYGGINKARVDVTIENNWAYEPSPQNFTYDAEILVGSHPVYNKAALTHFHHARWRKTYWWGGSPEVHMKHDTSYLIASKALPNYDTSIGISAAGLNSLEQRWNAANTSPMGSGLVTPAMPTTGGRADIGPLPQWGAMYLLSMDSRAKKITLGVGDLGGSWPVHYRDKRTDQIVSLADYPYMTLLGRAGDANNPITRKSELFPACGGDCKTAPANYQPDSSHQPSLAYLPYIVTGDYYYLEELQFWANWNMLQANPYYRGFDKGLLGWDQVRGQAWSMRTLGHAAYITPDAHPMKKYFTDRVAGNLEWYSNTYVKGNPNQLGVIDGSGQYAFRAIAYSTPSGAQTGVAPWMDDFFTWSVGYLDELGFGNAQPLLKWKAKFPVGRMTAPGYCWIDGATYALSVRPSATSPLYATLGEAYQATMRNVDGTPLANSTGAQYLAQTCGSQAQADWRTQKDKDNRVSRVPWVAGEMDGYSATTMGYPSNMQPALAVAATSGIPNAQLAWTVFINRSIKPDYSSAPQWAIVPRN